MKRAAFLALAALATLCRLRDGVAAVSARDHLPPGPDLRLPDWFLRHSPLTMDALKGPDEQYTAGARDMLAVVRSGVVPHSDPDEVDGSGPFGI